MTETTTATRPRVTPGDQPLRDDDTLAHVLCPVCRRKSREQSAPVRALCGAIKTGWTDLPGTHNSSPDMCRVCVEFVDRRCEKCGTLVYLPD